uniref:Uncharacterized protein n=1 Tax=Amphimedon queenslandica TaxID=400682 RepID=A0A1X7TJV9_AMPQE
MQDIWLTLEKSPPSSAKSYYAFASKPLTQAEEKFVEKEVDLVHALIELNKEFSFLIMDVQSGLQMKMKKDPEQLKHLIIWLEDYMDWNDKLTNASLDQIFKAIDPFYDFIKCDLIVDMSEKFLPGFEIGDDKLSIVSKLKNYKERANELQSSVRLEDLSKALKNMYKGDMRSTLNMPVIVMHLDNAWRGSDINGLSLLIQNLLPAGHQQSIMKYTTVTLGSVIITCHVLNSTADSLIEYTGGKLQFMHLIGIFSLYINDHPVLQEDENMNFTFKLGLLEAGKAGNNEAVEFLQTVNIDHTNEEGETALLLACKRGHKNSVHSLLTAGANVNIQDNKGWTALMRASKYNPISIIHMLLQANANPHLKNSKGSNAVMIASYYGNYEAVELLISKGVDYKYQREDGANAFMMACINGHTQIVELLLEKQIDPNVQNKDRGNAFMLACQNGHAQIVELLLKEQVDPNVQDKDGGNAFMLACQNGHAQIVELLLKEQVDPNVQEKDGWNAFMLACRNGHAQIVELLLKEQVDPNVQTNDGFSALLFACQNGDAQIVKLLLNEPVDLNIQNRCDHTVIHYCQSFSYAPIIQNDKDITAEQYEVAKLPSEWKADLPTKCNSTMLSLAETPKWSLVDV